MPFFCNPVVNRRKGRSGCVPQGPVRILSFPVNPFSCQFPPTAAVCQDTWRRRRSRYAAFSARLTRSVPTVHSIPVSHPIPHPSSSSSISHFPSLRPFAGAPGGVVASDFILRLGLVSPLSLRESAIPSLYANVARFFLPFLPFSSQQPSV